MNISSYIDTINYKIGYNLEIYLKNKNHSHIIIHGVKQCGKSLLLQTLFTDLFNTTTNKDKPIIHKFNNHYHLFDIKKIIDKTILFDFIKEIVLSYDQLNDCKYILIDHFELLSIKYQNILKVILEKCYLSTKFIIITNKINKMISALTSRCFLLRIPMPSSFDKYTYFQNKISLNNNDLIEKCKKINNLFHIQYNYENIMKQYTLNINNIITSKLNIQKIETIRKICSDIKELDIPFNELFKDFLDLINDNQLYLKFINIISYYDYLNCNAYRPLIHLETLILKLNMIYYNF